MRRILFLEIMTDKVRPVLVPVRFQFGFRQTLISNQEISYPMTFRSQKLEHYQLIIPRQISYDVTSELGRLGCIHLEDMSSLISRPFAFQVKRCDENLLRIQSIISFMKRKGIIPQVYMPHTDLEFTNQLLDQWQAEAKSTNVNPVNRINLVQDKIQRTWDSYQQLTSRLNQLNNTSNQNKGKMAVFAAAAKVLGASYFGARNGEEFQINSSQIDEGEVDTNGLSYFVSIVKREEQQRISKMVFRVSRGYAWTNFVESSSFQHIPQLAEFEDSVLFLFYPNSYQGTIQKKLRRIVESFSVETFELPRSADDFLVAKRSLTNQFSEVNDILALVNKQTNVFLNTLKSKRVLDQWLIFFTKQKLLYEGLNKMHIRQQFVTARFFIAQADLGKLDRLVKMTPTPIFNHLPLRKAPSRFQVNLFTYPGQQIVETYGVPRYGQINPGIFTSITFPFLFGVMFGDIAHGLVLFSFGLFLVLGADKLRGGTFDAFLKLRYMVILMGFFALYCGFIYNDFMGLGLNLFGSCFQLPMYGPGEPYELQPITLNCVYPVGVDPVWYRAQNQLQFMNSLKMKIAVIIAVIHMTFGIVLKAVNSIHFNKRLDLIFEFIPQIIFMVLMFGYMDFLIVFKWLKHWDPEHLDLAPSIITTMINIPLKLGKTAFQLGGMNMWGNSPDDTSQNSIQLMILLVSVLCIPMMLIPKPWIQIRQMKKKSHTKSVLQQQLLDERESQVTMEFEDLKKNVEEVQEIHDDAGEIVVHQIIQTIQFVLGCISNTASYLRLWALSLAHSQLARVFFNKTIQGGFKSGYSTIATLIIGFYLLAYVTFGVLMCMDTMECFLHALRLHWVQFQNKFFKADGVKFTPFSFKVAVEDMKAKQE